MAGNPPLSGIKVLELAGLAPGPFAGQMLADAGASVLRVDRCPSAPPHDAPTDPLARHKSSIAVDLKTARGQALIRRLCLSIDVLIDPFRPGVLERLNLGPAHLLAANPRLIYARLTGFRRDGRYSAMAGHDINYLSVSGVLDMLGRADERPHAPLNLLADFAGGGAMLVHGVLLALLARARSGRGQLVEANMVDGSSYLAAYPRATQRRRPRGRNLLDGGAPFYDTYATADGGHVAVGALEPRFFRRLVRGLGLQGDAAAGGDWDKYRADPQNWARIRRLFAGVFLSQPRRHWESVFDGTDACVTPVLSYGELALHPDRGGDQRPPVALADTPCRPLHGHGDEAYEGTYLKPGHGGRQLLESWLGWRDGVEYHVDKAGGLVLTDDVTPVKPSKL